MLETFSFAYDGDGLCTSASNSIGVVTNEYDAATGWLVSSRGADGMTVSYAYSNGGEVTGLVSVAGTTRYALDKASRRTRIDSPAGTMRLGYCAWNGKLAAVTNAHGLAMTYAYDVMDRVTNIAWTAADGTFLGGFTYEYDAAGRIVSRNHSLGGESFDRTYAYDALDRLASDGGVAYTYDAADNRMTRTENGETITYTLGIGDRLASYGRAASPLAADGGAYTYNAAGCVTRIERAGRPSLDLTWNGQYQLVSVATNDVFAESYAYDALRRRVSTTTSEGTVRHVYDDRWQCIADIDEGGNVVCSYVWGEGIDKLLAISIGGNVYYPLADIQGTVWGYVDSQNNVVVRWSYDAWGNVLSEEVSIPALASVRYRFQGRERSVATGLTNFRMRWYDAETGRWLSKDPIGLSGGLNLYAFCENVCLNGEDPFGEARIGNRGLHGGGRYLKALVFVPGLILPMSLTNTTPEHRHIFFDDGTNIGWGPEGFFCEKTADEYTMKGTTYNDQQLKAAVDKVKNNWNTKPYNPLTHNCQDFVDAVLQEYGR